MAGWLDRGRARARGRARLLGRCARTTRAPDGSDRTRNGFFARVRVEDYGPGRIRPHERTHPGPEGGPAAPDARDAREPLPHLQPLCRSRRRRGRTARAASRSRAVRTRRPTDDEGTRNALWRVSTTRISSPRCRRRLSGRRAADRRRPPPLRDRSRLRRRDRRRGRSPLRADVPRRAAGSRPDRLPHAPPADRARDDRAKQEAIRDALQRDFEVEELGSARRAGARRRRRGSAIGYSTAPQAALPRRRSRTRRSPTPRSPASPSPTGGSTPPCSRR